MSRCFDTSVCLRPTWRLPEGLKQHYPIIVSFWHVEATKHLPVEAQAVGAVCI